MVTPLINGTNYDWGQVTVILFGIPVIGITKIDYKRKQKKDNNYGIGYEPISRGYGQIEYDASIEIYQDELKRIIASAPNQDLLSIPPFDIQVIFQTKGLLLARDTLKMCEFTEDSVSASSGDTKLTVNLPLILAGIEHKKL
jgi:hypothetical protein